MQVKGSLLKILQPESQFDENQFYTEKELEEELKNKKPFVLEENGIEIFKNFIRISSVGFENFQDSFVSLYKVFYHYLKGEGVGIIKSIEYRSGFMKIAENVPLPCDLTLGILKGMMKFLKAKSVLVKHKSCQKEGFKFCEYEVNWMVSNVS